jgi:hypothetical protein
MRQIFNTAMGELIREMRNSTELDPALKKYLGEGLEIGADGSIVSVAAVRRPHTGRAHFADRVAYEAFVSKARLDDWSEQLHSAPVVEKIAQALLLADEVGRQAQQLDQDVAVIISVDSDADVIFRFHGLRPREDGWLGDIEGYSEPVLLRMYVSTSPSE